MNPYNAGGDPVQAIASPSALDGLLFAQHRSSEPCQTACGITPASDPVGKPTVIYKDAAALVQSADRTRRPFREGFPSPIPRQPVNSRPSEEVMVTVLPERSAWKTRLLPSSSVTVALALPS